VGIAYKLVHALFKQGLRLKGVRGRDLLDVVALGTVADMGPLTGENRVLVRFGLDAMRETERPGLLALMKEARVSKEHVDSLALGFMLGPRINAAGRLDDARRAYELLLAQDLATAERLAQELNRANRERQAITRSIVEEACLQAEVSGKDAQRIVLLDNEDYPSGIVGLVAGKLVERWARPVILIARGPDESRGSARSIERFNIYHALTACQEQFAHDNPGKDLFVRFGGHSRAAGFTIVNEHLPELESRMLAQAEQHLTDDLLEPLLCIDMEVPLHMLTWELYDQLAAFAPYGQVNHQPLLLSRGVHVLQQRSIGSDGQHLKLTVVGKTAQASTTPPLQAIAFGFGEQAEALRAHPDIDVVYTLEANIWKGTESLQLNVKDFRYC
jgi:single-stranded-DNA-specific exonuclease